jgi:hypothetical protein
MGPRAGMDVLRRENLLLLLGFEPRIVRTLDNLYIDYDIPDPFIIRVVK